MPPKKTKIDRSKLGTILAAVIIAFFMLNPETLELALFINAVGFDVYLLLLEIQLLVLAGLFAQYIIRPLINFFLGFSMHSFILPNWQQLKQDPGTLAHAMPTGAILMFLLTVLCVIGTIGLINGQGFLLINPV